VLSHRARDPGKWNGSRALCDGATAGLEKS
jgi:hypothetical protein